jgi:hypothetical protein
MLQKKEKQRFRDDIFRKRKQEEKKWKAQKIEIEKRRKKKEVPIFFLKPHQDANNCNCSGNKKRAAFSRSAFTPGCNFGRLVAAVAV